MTVKAVLLLALAAALGAGCGRRAPGDDAPAAGSAAHDVAPATAATAPGGESLYQLRPALTDQDGRALTLDVFAGHPVVVSMFYGSCPAACPLLVGDIKELERGLDPDARRDLRVLLVSFDPSRDTPDALRKLARRHGVDLERWRFASAPEADARELAAVLGIQYRKLADGEFSHSVVMSVLDRHGIVTGRYEGSQPFPPDFVEALRAAAKR